MLIEDVLMTKVLGVVKMTITSVSPGPVMSWFMRWRAGCDIAEYVDSTREFVYRNFFSFLSYLTSLLWPTRLLFLVRLLMLWACGSWVFAWILWDSVLPNYYATRRISVRDGYCAPCVIGVRLKVDDVCAAEVIATINKYEFDTQVGENC